MRLVISDAHEGLRAAVRKNVQGASWQRCRVHDVRNPLAPVPEAHQEMVAAAFRSIFTLTTPDDVTARWDAVHDWAVARRYFSEASMAKLYKMRDTDPAVTVEREPGT